MCLVVRDSGTYVHVNTPADGLNYELWCKQEEECCVCVCVRAQDVCTSNGLLSDERRNSQMGVS